MTLLLFILCADYLQRKKIGLKSDKYILFQAGTICFMLAAGAINGKLGKEIIVPLIGYLNIAIGTFGCVLFYRRVNNPFMVIKRAIVKANIFHIFFGIMQLENASIAFKVTGQLYTTSSRSIPLEEMSRAGAFYRIFGATYSPTLLGGYILFSFSYVIALILVEKGKNKKDFLLLLSTVLLGFMAFSKTVIWGMPVMAGISLIWMLFHGGIQYRKFFVKVFSLLLIAFGFFLVYAKYFGLWGQVQYYFGMITDPSRIFRGRYNSANIGDPKATSGVAGALAMFMRHPVIGVGMVPLADEFIWDTQYIGLLHNGGVILLAAVLLFYVSVYLTQKKRSGIPQIMILFALMFVALATNVLTVANYIPFIALCVGVNGDPKKINEYL